MVLKQKTTTPVTIPMKIIAQESFPKKIRKLDPQRSEGVRATRGTPPWGLHSVHFKAQCQIALLVGK